MPEPVAADVEVHLLDSASTRTPAPRPCWAAGDFGLHALVPGCSDARRTTLVLRSCRGIAQVDHERRTAIVWVPSSAEIPWWERAAPMRWLFDAIGRLTGTVLVHAAAFARRGRGVLVAGRGGSGKSTLALAAARAGLDFLGDDYVLLDIERIGRCHALYGTIKLRKPPLSLDGWPVTASGGADGKWILHAAEAWPAQMALSCTIAGLLLPRFAPAGGPLARVPPGTALTALTTSTLAQGQVDGPRMVATAAALARSVPSFRLLLPPSTDAALDAIEPLLATCTEA
jgi:hypothetical protein